MMMSVSMVHLSQLKPLLTQNRLRVALAVLVLPASLHIAATASRRSAAGAPAAATAAAAPMWAAPSTASAFAATAAAVPAPRHALQGAQATRGLGLCCSTNHKRQKKMESCKRGPPPAARCGVPGPSRDRRPRPPGPRCRSPPEGNDAEAGTCTVVYACLGLYVGMHAVVGLS